MEGKSSKSAFNKAARKRPHRNITEWDMNKKLDKFKGLAKLNKKPDQVKAVQDIQDKFYKDKTKTNTARGFQLRNLDLGHRAGLHRKTTPETLQKGFNQEDQLKREKAVDKAKKKYHRNFSLSDNFNDKANKTRDKSIDRDR